MDMRVICDHCGDPVAGTVKRAAGNLNLHPECLAQLGGESPSELTAVSWRSGDSSVSMLLQRTGIAPNLPRKALPDSDRS